MSNLQPTGILQLPIDEATEIFSTRLDQLQSLHSLWERGKLTPRDEEFVSSLCNTFIQYFNLTPNQWYWVGQLASRYAEIEPIYGSFNPILVMFRLAQSHGLKRPKVRLLSADADPVYFELWFRPGEKDEKVVEIMKGGWQGSGRRHFAGWIHHDSIVPFRSDRITVGIKNTIQDLALDPSGVAKAMAQRLSACMYCGQRLSDQESKDKGYGPVCARHWELPWGSSTNQPIPTALTDNILDQLFAS
jgi:hypothetical protein